MNKIEQQTNYEEALRRALDFVRRRPMECLAALGARNIQPSLLELPVLEGIFQINLETGEAALLDEHGVAREERLRKEWIILALHYLSADSPWLPCASWWSFGDLPQARGYESVYGARVIGRLCATAGQKRDQLAAAAERLGARRVPLRDEGFSFQVFPRVEIRIFWYPGDDELGPGVSFLYPDNVLCFLSVEDIVVVSERLVGRLSKRGW